MFAESLVFQVKGILIVIVNTSVQETELGSKTKSKPALWLRCIWRRYRWRWEWGEVKWGGMHDGTAIEKNIQDTVVKIKLFLNCNILPNCSAILQIPHWKATSGWKFEWVLLFSHAAEGLSLLIFIPKRKKNSYIKTNMQLYKLKSGVLHKATKITAPPVEATNWRQRCLRVSALSSPLHQYQPLSENECQAIFPRQPPSNWEKSIGVNRCQWGRGCDVGWGRLGGEEGWVAKLNWGSQLAKLSGTYQ